MARTAILRLAGPLVVSFWLRSAFAWVDLFFAADLQGPDGIGDASVAAIGMALPFEFLTIACWVGASNGLTARLAAAMGAREGDRVEQLKRAAVRIILALIAFFLLVAVGIWFLAPTILRDSLDPLLTRQFQIYAAILLGGSAVTSFWAILPDSVVKAHHDTPGTMWAGLLSGFCNVVLNAVFVYVFGWGIAGIAFSTVLGRVAGLSFALHRAAGHERRRVAETEHRPGVFERPVRAILTLAVPGAITYLLMSLESLAVLGLIANLPPEDLATPLLAAWSVFDRMLRFLLMPAIACSVALLPLVARHDGAGNRAAIRAELRVAQRAGLVYALVIVLPLCLLAGPAVARMLAEAPDTRRFAVAGMVWVPFAVAASLPFFLARATFDGLQKPKPGLIASLLRAFVFFIPAMALGWFAADAFGWGPMTGLCLGATVGLALGSAVIRTWIGRHLAEAEGAAGGDAGSRAPAEG